MGKLWPYVYVKIIIKLCQNVLLHFGLIYHDFNSNIMCFYTPYKYHDAQMALLTYNKCYYLYVAICFGAGHVGLIFNIDGLSPTFQ